MTHYQENLSLQSPILLDLQHKQPKVDKMLAILNDCGALMNTTGGAVDIGCSAGFFIKALAPYFQKTLGLDIDINALGLAMKSNPEKALFSQADSMNLPLKANSVDLIICNHTYEHVPHAERLFEEISRVLKPSGYCYLGAASRLTFIEPHYKLPFLSWLPKCIAHKYLTLSGKGREYYENLRTYWGIRRLISRFELMDYTLAVMTDPDKYHARDMIAKNGLIEKVPALLWKAVYPLLPSYIFILKKAEQK